MVRLENWAAQALERRLKGNAAAITSRANTTTRVRLVVLARKPNVSRRLCRVSRNASLTQFSQRAAERELLLVPGVMSSSEVHQARRLGCRIVKLFPAVSVGIKHWRRLREPLGVPLPFCIAAGGLKPADVLPWLAAGVDAVALGSGLGDLEEVSAWRELLSTLAARSPSA
jgi:hypothetical protein